jgi:hypothetical protein
LFEASKRENDFNNMIDPMPILEKEEDPETKEEVIEDATLYTMKAVLVRKSEGWRFVYKDVPITVSMRDANFIDKTVDGDVEFRSGDRLICRMTLVKKYDKSIDTFTIKKYIVTKVHRLVKRDNQGTIEF